MSTDLPTGRCLVIYGADRTFDTWDVVRWLKAPDGRPIGFYAKAHDGEGEVLVNWDNVTSVTPVEPVREPAPAPAPEPEQPRSNRLMLRSRMSAEERKERWEAHQSAL